MVVIPPKKFLSDSRGKPGELVVLRGTKTCSIFRVPSSMGADIAGTANPGSMGMIICIDKRYREYTYVLWSDPCVVGWIQDGYLRRI